MPRKRRLSKQSLSQMKTKINKAIREFGAEAGGTLWPKVTWAKSGKVETGIGYDVHRFGAGIGKLKRGMR